MIQAFRALEAIVAVAGLSACSPASQREADLAEINAHLEEGADTANLFAATETTESGRSR